MSTGTAQDIYAVSIATGLLALIAVVFRFVARTKSKIQLGLDDGFILLSLVLFWGEVGTTLWSTSKVEAIKADMSPESSSLQLTITTLKALYIGSIFSILTISAAKLSVICLYYRIFSINKTYRSTLLCASCASVAWLIACIVMAIWSCIPIEAAWNPLVQGRCLNLELVFVITESVNCATDLGIVCLAVGMVKKLRLSLQHKIEISFVFALGGLVTITSVLRIVYIYHPNERNSALVASNLWNSTLWAYIQLSCAIFCACLPTYKSILPSGTMITSGLRYFYDSRARPRWLFRLLPKMAQNQSSKSGHMGDRRHHRRYGNLSNPRVNQISLAQVGADKKSDAKEEYSLANLSAKEDGFDIV